MTLSRFLAGIPLSLFALVPIGLASRVGRELLLSGWRGLEAVLVEVVLALSLITLVAELLGTFDTFETLPVALGLAASGLILWLVGLRVLDRRSVGQTVESHVHAADATPDRSWWRPAVAIGGTLIIAGAWLARTIDGIERGMTTVDTIWYHLPVAARFVQTKQVSAIHYLDQDPVTAFFPAGSSLLHGIGILMFGTDLVSTIANLAWLALALVAAWCVGRPFGVAPATTLGVALLLGTPGLVATQPGGAYNDVAGLALLLTAIAVIVQHRPAERSTGQDVVAALAAGLAIGMKFTFVLPAIALCLGLALTAPKGLRVRRTILVVASAAVTGGYWYARNAIVTGNPLPSLSVSLGPFSLPSVEGATPTSRVAKFLFDGPAWTDYFIPGLRSSLGPAWPAIVVFALAGMVGAAVQRSDARVRMLGIVGIASIAAYLVTPQYLVGGFGRPFFFSANLRYASAAIAIGLALLPVVLRRWRNWVLIAYALALVVTQLDPTSWPTGFEWATFASRVSGRDAAGAVGLLAFGSTLAIAIARRRVPGFRARPLLTGIALPVAVLIGLACVHGRYLDDRYTDASPYPQVYAWARDVKDARIAVAGLFMESQYPITGTDLSNYVQYAGVRAGRGSFRGVETCDEWVEFLESGRYDYVVIAPTKNLAAWTAAQPDARLTYTEPLGADGSAAVEVYQLDSDRSRRSCTAASVGP